MASAPQEPGALIASPLRGEVDAQRRVRGSVSRSRALRSTPTDAETKLWGLLRARQLEGHKFVRQLPIGRYFADFVCREVALVVEVDGGQHAEAERDDVRTAFLNSEGYSVLRFWNDEVLTNPQGVAEIILAALTPHPTSASLRPPSPLSGEGRGKRGAAAATAIQRSFPLTADLPRLLKE